MTEHTQATVGRRWWQIRKKRVVEIVCQACGRPIRAEVPPGWTVDDVITAETLACPCGMPLDRLMLPETQLIPSLRSWRKNAARIMGEMLLTPVSTNWTRSAFWGPLSVEEREQIVCLIHWKLHAAVNVVMNAAVKAFAKGLENIGKREAGAGTEEAGRAGRIQSFQHGDCDGDTERSVS